MMPLLQDLVSCAQRRLINVFCEMLLHCHQSIHGVRLDSVVLLGVIYLTVWPPPLYGELWPDRKLRTPNSRRSAAWASSTRIPRKSSTHSFARGTSSMRGISSRSSTRWSDV